MAILKCKMCGGDLNVSEGATVCECEYCGTQQTIPSVDDEKKLKLFDRANRLRMACEFDKAYGVYETIAGDFEKEAEAYWGLVLCKYGIEYVDDPATGNKIPTCHRSSFDSVFEDDDFKLVLENADVVAKSIYQKEAATIEEIRKGIIEISSKEEPYDIFICYKETDSEGNRTIDSVIAQDVYDALIEKKYRVFFARITLEDKLGQEYEPYIFSALHSARVMLVFGTDYDYFNAVWVKNEWSRFLKFIENGEKKTIVPCYKGIDAYDLPKEFAKLQAQDMGKIGAIQDLLRGIEKIIGKKTPKEEIVKRNATVSFAGPLVESANDFLRNREFLKAREFFDKALEYDARNEEALIGVLLTSQKSRSIEEMVNGDLAFLKSINYTKLLSCCSEKTKEQLNDIVARIKRAYYDGGNTLLSRSDWKNAKEKFSYLLQFEPESIDFLIGKMLAEVQVPDFDSLNSYPFESNETYKKICSVGGYELKEKLRRLNEEAKINHENKIVGLLESGKWKDTITYCDYVLKIFSYDENALLGKLLAEQQCARIEDITSRDISFIRSGTFLKLYESGSEETKEELDKIANATLKVKLKEAEEFLQKQDWSNAKIIYNKLLGYFKDEPALLIGKMMAEMKASCVNDLSNCELPFDNNQTYLKLLEVADEKTKNALITVNEKIKKGLFASVEENLKNRNWYDLRVSCNKLLRVYPNNEEALLALFFASVECTCFEELKSLNERFTSQEAYKRLTGYCSNETKKKLEECAKIIDEKIKKREKKKKMISLAIKIGIVLAVVLAIVIFIFYRKTDKFIYGLKKTEGGYAVTRYKGKETEVEIPSEYKGKPIVRIEEGAFEGEWDITSVVVPNSVTSIGLGAFEDCSGINVLSIPFVGDGGENTHLTYIFGAEKPTDNVSCPSMEITLTNCTEIGDYAFYGANPSNVKWDSDIKRIGDYAFYNCDNLGKVFLSDTIESVGESAFEECSYVEQFFIPKSVKRIGANAFYKCKKATIYLEMSTFPDEKDGYYFHEDWNSSGLPVEYDSYLTNGDK